MESRAREVDSPCAIESGWWRTGVLENGTKGRNLLKWISVLERSDKSGMYVYVCMFPS